ncbi:MAG: efflux transporter outer membrane subunit [Limisphaerales bacterium]
MKAERSFRHHAAQAGGLLRRGPITGIFLALILLAGCAVGPDYERPAVDTPPEHRRADSDPAAAEGTSSFGDLGWAEVFVDPVLRGYLAEALTNNWDVKIAAARVLQAQASARVVRSQYYPNVALGGDLVTTRTSEEGPFAVPPGSDPEATYGTAFASMSSYEVDLWGRIRRASEGARARLLATEAAQESVRQTLVAEVAAAYVILLQLDYELEISRRTYLVRTNSLNLTTARQEGGVASMQDVVQARVLVDTADAATVDVLRRQEQQENVLGLLLGRNPGTLARGRPLREQPTLADVPPGLPSSLLERRPDVRAAEQQLVAANASVGEARAAFFPQLSLTGMFGFQSVSLGDLFTSPAQIWQFGPTLVFPVFTGGRLKGQYELAKGRFDEAVAQYRQSVQGAFREVSDALIQHQRTREFTVRQERVTQSRREGAELANIRYDGGVTSYLEVLYSEEELFTAELALARAIGDELLSYARLYRALGGGWTGPGLELAGATAQP